MISFKTLLIATAVVSIAGISGAAEARNYVTTESAAVINTPSTVVVETPVVTRVIGGRVVAVGPTVAADSKIAVGTRKVGMVGGRPYPIEKMHAENTTVTATPSGLVERKEITKAGGTINVNSGGEYYTSTDGAFYADPAWNVNVHSSGGYND